MSSPSRIMSGSRAISSASASRSAWLYVSSRMSDLQSIERNRGAAQKLLLDARRVSFVSLPVGAPRLFITTREHADRPVAPRHAALGAEGLQHEVEVQPDMIRVPGLRHPARGAKPRNLRVHVRVLRCNAEILTPLPQHAGLNRRLAQVV